MTPTPIDRLLDQAFGPLTAAEQTALDEILAADAERRQRIEAACGATLLIGRAMYGTCLGGEPR